MALKRATCPVCRRKITLKTGALLRVHGHPVRPCLGGDRPPNQCPSVLDKVKLLDLSATLHIGGEIRCVHWEGHETTPHCDYSGKYQWGDSMAVKE